MKPPPFAYHDPTTIEEAADLIGRLENAMPLAGGQSLMPMLNFRVVAPDHLIDLNRKFRDWLKSKGVQHVDIETGGAHTWMVWRRNLTNFSSLLFK